MNRFIRASSLLALFLLLPYSTLAHKYFTSLTTVQLSEDKQSLEIIHRLTTHDLEFALTELSDSKVNLEHQKFSPLLKSYVEQSFSILCDNASVPEWVGFESDIHDTWIYQELSFSTQPTTCTIGDTILMQHFPEQVNTVNYQIGRKQGSLVFTDEKVQKIK